MMSALREEAPRRHYTLEEYFALEKLGEARYEYWDGDIVCMSGGLKGHAFTAENVFFHLRSLLAKGSCRTFNSETPIKTPTLPPYRYADVGAVCGKPLYEKMQGIDVLTNPTLVVEVLSRSTEMKDRNSKRDAYQALPSLQQYLLISQNEPHLTLFTRLGDKWQRQDIADMEGAIKLVSINCELALKDVYENVEFE
jgi:Uma2 family endonuclease